MNSPIHRKGPAASNDSQTQWFEGMRCVTTRKGSEFPYKSWQMRNYSLGMFFCFVLFFDTLFTVLCKNVIKMKLWPVWEFAIALVSGGSCFCVALKQLLPDRLDKIRVHPRRLIYTTPRRPTNASTDQGGLQSSVNQTQFSVRPEVQSLDEALLGLLPVPQLGFDQGHVVKNLTKRTTYRQGVPDHRRFKMSDWNQSVEKCSKCQMRNKKWVAIVGWELSHLRKGKRNLSKCVFEKGLNTECCQNSFFVFMQCNRTMQWH